MIRTSNLVKRVKESTADVCRAAEHVHLKKEEAWQVAHAMSYQELEDLTSDRAFDADLHFIDNGPLTVLYLLCVDSINFCFWPQRGLEYEHLARGLKEALIRDKQALDPHKLANINGNQLQKLLSLTTPMPAQDRRAELLREVGQQLLSKFDGRPENLIAQAEGSAVSLVDLIANCFPGFQDCTMYRGRQVWFLKRAQIFVGDVWGAFQGQGLGRFDDISELSMFADYRVPVVLRQMGILVYSARLANTVDKGQELAAGSEEEVEIRACTIQAVEEMKSALRERSSRDGCPVPHSVQLDWFLWERGERERETAPPHHRTLTTFY
ncbi:Queuosine salvage protein [Coccomyxa sp. Obi]|nr:Queuosine salvage protein [Coccomyxa sp. Obi]